MPDEDMFDFSETMVLYQVTNSDTENNEAGLQSLIAQGYLRAVRLGGTMKFRKADLESLAEEGVLTARNGWERNLAGAERRQKLEELANDPTLTDGQRVLALEDLDNFRSLISGGAEASAGNETVFTDRDLQVLPLDDEPESEAPAAKMVPVGTDPDLGVQMEYDDDRPALPRQYIVLNKMRIAKTVGLVAAVMGAYAVSTIWMVNTAAKNNYAKGLEDGAAQARGSMPDLEKAILDERNGFVLDGFNHLTRKFWQVRVPLKDYMAGKENSGIEVKPNQIKEFVGCSARDLGQYARDVANHLTMDAKTDADKAQLIFEYLRRNIVEESSYFGFNPKNPNGPMSIKHPVETLIEKGAQSQDLAVLAASMLESQGIPTVLLYFHGDAKTPPYVAAAVDITLPKVEGMERTFFPVGNDRFCIFAPETECRDMGIMPYGVEGKPVTAFRVTKK